MATQPNKWHLPDLGFGIGLRTPHYAHILEYYPPVDWFEIISENFIDAGARPQYVLERILDRYPVVMHGVSMSIGSADHLNMDYLQRLKALARIVQPAWISDHLCWTGVNGINTHDLLPITCNHSVLKHIVERIRIVQDVLERPLVLENVSSYMAFSTDSIPEWEFIAMMAEQADCGILLDVNNIYVSSYNHGWDPLLYIDTIPAERICQYHLAGYRNKGAYILDTHSDHVVDEVWNLYRYAQSRTGGRATLLEWDEDIPDFATVHAEAQKARQYCTTINPVDASLVEA